MPQKKNPDALELLRGKGGRVMGQLSGFMTTMKGLPSTYNKDMQEDKAPRHLSFCALPCVCSPVADSAGPSREEPLFHIVDTMQMTLPVASGVLATMSVVPARMEARLASEMLATDLAEYLVRKGVPFRQTHHIAGDAVKLAEDRRRAFPTALDYDDARRCWQGLRALEPLVRGLEAASRGVRTRCERSVEL